MNAIVQSRIDPYVAGLTFCDVGGLWGTVNEKVSGAILAGAKSATMADMQPADHALWTALDRRCAMRGVSSYRKVVANVDAPDFKERVGVHDFVHCAGILYHVPNPIRSISQIASIAGRYLMLGSMTVPETIRNERGEVTFGGGRVFFVPAATPADREILAAHFTANKIKAQNINSETDFPWGQPGDWKYGPWWWLWTGATLARMVELCGFRTLEIIEPWPGCSHVVLAERI